MNLSGHQRLCNSVADVTQSIWNELSRAWLDVWRQQLPEIDELVNRAMRTDPALIEDAVPSGFSQQDVQVLLQIADGLRPATVEARESLRRSLWARWAVFESASRVALGSADLLTFAGVVRSWDEELSFIENFEPVLQSDFTDEAPIRHLAVCLASRGISRRVAPDFGIAKREPRYPWSELNALIHPNSLGHITLLMPEKTDSIRILLVAYAELGARAHSLLKLTEQPRKEPSSGSPGLGRGLSEYRTDILRLAEDIEFERAQRCLKPADIEDSIIAYFEDLKRPDLSQLDSDDPLVIFFGGSVNRDSNASRPELGLLQHPVSRAVMPFGTRAWCHVEPALDAWLSSMPGSPDALVARLDYLQALVNAAVLTVDLRRLHHIEALVRALASRNPLLVGLASRGVLEHHAAVIYAGSLSSKVFSTIRTARAASPQEEEALLKVERYFLCLLFGGPGPGGQVGSLAIRARTEAPLVLRRCWI